VNVYGIITVNRSMRSGGTGRPVARGFQGLKSEGYTLPSRSAITPLKKIATIAAKINSYKSKHR
jgi:hypothetical protein